MTVKPVCSTMLVLALAVFPAVSCGGPGRARDTAGPDASDTSDTSVLPDAAAEAIQEADIAPDIADILADPTPDAAGETAAETVADLPARLDAIPGDIDPDTLALPPFDPAPDVNVPDGVTVRAGTYNVYSCQRGTPEAIGAALAPLGLDLLGLEECSADLASRIATAAGFAYVQGDGDALLSRTPLEGFAEIAMGDARSLSHATTVIDGVTFSVYVAHLSWRVEGVKQCVKFANEVLPADPIPHVVMVGDFNDEHGSTQITALEAAMVGAETAMGWHAAQRISWPSTGFDETEGSQLIDMVFFRRAYPAIVVSADVLNLSPTLSDHKPSIAELRFPRDPATPFTSDPFAASRDPFGAIPQAKPPNLLANPGAEEGLAGWAVKGGAAAVAQREQQAPHSGGAFFTGFTSAIDPGAPWSSGSQTVDLSAHAAEVDASRGVVYASAWIATGYQVEEKDGLVADIPLTYDDGEVVVEAIDGAGGVLDRLASGRRDPLAWDPFAAAVPLPPGSRAARITWISHQKLQGGPGNDAAFDDVYLGYGTVDSPHRVLGGNLLANPGAEAISTSSWTADAAWSAQPDLAGWGPWGPDFYPPWAWSGYGYFYAGADVVNGGTAPGLARMSQTIDLGGLRAAADEGGVAVRWGGRVRTYRATAGVRVGLDVLDANGSTWHTFTAPEVRAAEWTEVRQRTLVPPGAAGVRLVLTAQVDTTDDGVFADELYVVPERASSP